MSNKVKDLFEVLVPLMNYQDSDWKILQQEAQKIASWTPDIVEVFYNTVYASDATADIFHEGERKKLEKTLENWVLSLAKGTQGDAFWEHQWFIALMHVQRGVNNLYMLGMMNRIQQVVLVKCVEHYNKEKSFEVFNAFLRISGAISTLIAECYGVVLESCTQDALSRVGMNPALLQRIKSIQLKKMIAKV